MTKQSDEFIWAEKYRPTSVDACILPKSIKSEISTFIKDNQIPHFLFSGTAGVGKTSIGKAIAAQLDADLLYINASSETGIDTVRTKVIQFASTASFDGNLKIVLLDECDRLSDNAQDALKATMEEFSMSTRFILTSNKKHKIIDPIKSRCTQVDFKVPEDEKRDLLAQMMKRCATILKQESIEYDAKSLVALVQQFFPDFRKTLNELQRYSTYGKIDAGVLVAEATSFDDLIKFLKSKKYADVRTWVSKNADVDSYEVIRYFYENLDELFIGKSMPNVILTLQSYQRDAAVVADQEINHAAFLTELMGVAEWK